MEIINENILKMMVNDCADNHVALIAPETVSCLEQLIERVIVGVFWKLEPA